MNTRSHFKNDLLRLNYFTIIASVLLFFFGYMVGFSGLITVSLLLSALMYFSVLNRENKLNDNKIQNKIGTEREATLTALAYLSYALYLSLGVNSWLTCLKEVNSPTLFSYIFLISLSIPILSYSWLIKHKTINNQDISAKMG